MDLAFLTSGCKDALGRERPERRDGDGFLKAARRCGQARGERSRRARLELLTGVSDSSGIGFIESRGLGPDCFAGFENRAGDMNSYFPEFSRGSVAAASWVGNELHRALRNSKLGQRRERVGGGKAAVIGLTLSEARNVI